MTKERWHNFGIVKQDPYIGKEYGIYKIVEATQERSADGHRIYKGVCKECGHVRYARINSFKQRNVQICNHKNSLSDEQIQQWYEDNKRRCLYCGKDIPLRNLGFNEYKERKFCDNSCAASYNNKNDDKRYEKRRKEKEPRFCKNCGKEIKFNQKYCSTKCQQEYRYKTYIEKWKNGEESGTAKNGPTKQVKRYIKEKYNNQCCKCGWHEINPITGKVPVEIHHVDGNYKNNKEENLELLCPNCHSLTPTYKALNCGEGRKDRYK